MIRRRDFISLIGGSVFGPLNAMAEQDRQMPRIGVLTGNVETDPAAQHRVAAFPPGPADLGWSESDIQIEGRWPGANLARQEGAARELVEWAPDVILATSTPTTRALRDCT